ncbi:MAG: glycosyltransferase [Janthinobacterium sp.]|jgi:glycosyltransferase involved in cell wall biosynthesis
MRISVCIATFNGAKYIKAQLSSILNQLGKDDEVIVSDDSSSDHTIEIIRQFNDSRIKIYSDNKFQSPILNFEHAISKATGKYIFLSDQDDEWAPDKVATLLPLLEEKMLVASHFRFIDQHSNPL